MSAKEIDSDFAGRVPPPQSPDLFACSDSAMLSPRRPTRKIALRASSSPNETAPAQPCRNLSDETPVGAIGGTPVPAAPPAAPRKRNYAVAIAFAAGMLIMAMLAAGAYFVLSKGTRGTSISAASQAVKDAQAEENRETGESEAEATKETEETERADRESEGREESEAEERREDAGTGKPPQPSATGLLVDGISQIVLCKDDDEVRERFGHPMESGLSEGSVWCYDEGGALVERRFNDKASGKDASWGTRDDDFTRYDLLFVADLPARTDYCRIWHFRRKPKALFWVFTSGGTFTLKPPYGTVADIAAQAFGPDGRVQRQWLALHGSVRFTATAKGRELPAGEYRGEFDGAFNPREFIADVRAQRLKDLERELEEARGILAKARKETGGSSELERQRAKQREMLEAVRRDMKSAERELAEIPEKERQCQREIDEMTTLGMNAPGPNVKDRAYERKKRAMQALENLKAKKSELEKRLVENKAKYMKAMAELEQVEAMVRKRESHVDECRRCVSDLEEAKAAFPTIDDALRTWEIDVGILGFEEEGMK